MTETFGQDVRFALRLARKSPGFAATAIVTLALGIGVNTAMFTVIDSVLIRPLPYKNADRLVSIGQSVRAQEFNSTSWLNLEDIRKQSKTIADAAGYVIDVAILGTPQGGQTMLGTKVMGNLMSLLGAGPMLGRTINDADCKPGAPLTVVLSERLWREKFGADPHVVGREVRIGDLPHTVIGVMPASFRFPEEDGAEAGKGVWLPSQLTEEMKGRGFTLYSAVGRLRAGASVQQARAELATIAQQIRRTQPADAEQLQFAIRAYRETVTGAVRPVFLALMAALGLVLLIACANVANLQLSRSLGRYQELAVRTAMGAPKWRLIRQLLIEGGTLSALGALAGLGLAAGALGAIRLLPEDMIPRASEIHLRFAVLAALAGLAALATVLSSMIPALFAVRAEPQTTLRGSGRGMSQRAVQSRMARWLVMGEVGIAAVLMVACSLLFRTLYNLEHKWLGFSVENVVTFTATPPNSSGYLSAQKESGQVSIATHTYEPLLEQLRALPGVSSAALTSSLPFGGVDMGSSFTLNGNNHPTPEEKQRQDARIRVISGQYMASMRTPVVRGRAISDDDTEDQPFVMNVNEAFAKKFLTPLGDPIGQRIELGGKHTGMAKPYTVVGVVADAVQKSSGEPALPDMMLPFRQVPAQSLFYPILVASATGFVVRTQLQGDMSSAIHGVFQKVAPGFAIDDLRTMQETVNVSNLNQRLGFYLIGSFAALAVVMVVVGLYGVLSQLVSQRRQEIGVRMALGATSQSILGLILRQGSVLIGVGLVAGVVTALGVSRVITSFLYGVQPMDAWSYGATAILLILFGLTAALIPARRAANIEPMEALRTE